MIFILKCFAQEVETDFETINQDGLELLEKEDSKILKDHENSIDKFKEDDLNLSTLEEVDDLEAIKGDIGDLTDEKIDGDSKQESKQNELVEDDSLIEEVVKSNEEKIVINDEVEKPKKEKPKVEIFDVGDEEKRLLELSKFVSGKISEKEWDEISTYAKTEKYIVQEGDWLWKISEKLFGSGFYYSKIWSLNPSITNPHKIEPGMVLVFNTGDANSLPNVRVGSFDDKSTSVKYLDFNIFGEGDNRSPWLYERQRLIEQGLYFQYASKETYDDLKIEGSKSLVKEYNNYQPPHREIIIQQPPEEYDDVGFDKYSKISFNFSEGFYLNTFITSNILVDVGEMVATPSERVFVHRFDRIYVKFNKETRVKPGDLFSIYEAHGKSSHPISDRSGYRYTITAQLRLIAPKDDLWECEVKEVTGVVTRGARLTLYMAKINKVFKFFNKRHIEAALIDSPTKNLMYSMGDVVYLDRGRADGVELGTVFEVYDYYDRGTGKRITISPTYKTGEISVITVTDNFSTGLLTGSNSEIKLGAIALTKTAEQVAREHQLKNNKSIKNLDLIESGALDELDIELNLDDASEDLLNKADSIKLSEDELEELDRQEREKSIIKDHEKDLQELERLEKELEGLESKSNEYKVDEDKLLEQQNLNEIEGKTKDPSVDAFMSLDELEKDVGVKYLDQELNARENPYGLTEFDLEEIDELLNNKDQK